MTSLRLSDNLLPKLALAFLIPLAAFGAKAVDSLTMADFVYTNKLMVAGYTNETTLVNFPVLVRINTSLGDFQYSRMRSTKGGDLAFFAADGTKLASEVDTWTTSGTSLVWVKLPSMTQGTQFYMCYRLTDELAALDTMVENPNPWGDYVGVWHLRETGTSPTIEDATENGLNGTASADNGEGASAGRIGRARRIAKNNNHDAGIIVDVKSDATKKAVADSLGTDFHASFWVRTQGNVGYSYLLGRRKGDCGRSWGVQFDSGATPSQVRIFSGSPRGSDDNQDAATAGECVKTGSGVGTTLADKTWRKVDVIWKDTTNGGTAAYDFYIDGAFVETKNLIYHVNLEDANIGIGCSTQDAYGDSPAAKKGRRLNGDMDEVRLRPGVVSADWIKADYDTVNNENFVTEAQPEVTWVNDPGASPGVSYIHHDYVGFGGTVTDCGGFPSCSIQCKVWATSGSEPETWTTLTNGLVAADAFSVAYSGLAPDTAYSYKLRASGGGEEDAGSMPVSGSFTTLAGFAVAWSTDTDATGLSEIHHDKVVVAGEVATLGDVASFEVQWKCWADGASEPEGWTTITNVLGAAAFEVAVSELAASTTYNYSLRAAANDGETTTPVVGTFTTEPELTILWSESTGIVQVGYDFVKIGGTVRALGDASSCIVQRKIWVSGEIEPDWTASKGGLVKDASFTDVVGGLELGTTYSYKLRACGDDEEATEVVEGTFVTLGESGEVTGSPYTEFFDDGTNAVWVVKDFERYLPFTVTGYSGSEVLTNFPVLVEVRKDDKDTNGFSYDDFYHYDGADIAFVDAKGHIIPHEIDTWNKNGMSLFWVRLPEMNNGTTFTMCYRSPLLERPPDPGNTFEKYVGVWHMNERDDGVVNLKDSTVNDLETETHAMSKADGNGRIGYARRVAQTPGSSSSFGRIIAFDHDDILRTGVGNVFTFSGWYKLAATPPKWAYLVSRKSEDADKGWGIQYGENDSTTELRVWSGSSAKNKFQIFKTPGMASTGWNYWTFIYDGGVNLDGTTNRLFHAYLNGEELGSTITNFVLSYEVVNDDRATYDHLVIGGQQNGTGAFNGLVDEARYSKGIRSADWIKAEYDSSLQQVYWNDAGKRFVTKGVVSRGVDSLVPVVVWERGAGLPNTILDVSYAYVQFAGTVTYCGAGADECRIEYRLWVDGEQKPEAWTTLADGLTPGTYFSIPVTGLKQDMLYNFSIRAVNMVDGLERQSYEHAGQFRTNGNMELSDVEGELLRVGDKFVHRYRAGSYTFTTPDYVTNVEILVVGGGGAGGYMVGGGGGGGGLFYSESFPVETSTVYRVQVGQGGNAATSFAERSENGEISYFALASDEANPLIRMHGGGAGGSYTNDADFAIGASGASGGGGTYAEYGGVQAMMGLPEEFRPFGNVGGRGNDKFSGGSIGKVAAGGGGGAGRAGLGATFDTWSAGGSGGVGVANSMTGELLFYGAGGGGGYIYRTAVANDGTDNFTKPGGGGSGIGGNAADVRNGTPATSGVENTGAGGGGGSSRGKGDGSTVDASDSTYWKGGDGGDGVVLISYEAHGRDPISEEPQITMVKCDYVSDNKVANINYRAYWAGVQAQTNDVYVLYSTVSEDDVAAGNGDMVKVATNTIAIGSASFTPPEVGYQYWVRLVAKKDANSFMYSEEIATFFVPAVEINGTDPRMPDENGATNDYAIISYNLYDEAPDARLYCYWSENQEDLEGDTAPTGSAVRFLDLGTGRAGKGKEFRIRHEDGIERNKTYYVRLATGDSAGTKYFLSRQIVLLEMVDKPRVIFDEGVWASHKATVDFLLTTAEMDPSGIDLVALYSGDENLVKADPAKTNLVSREGVVFVNLGSCSQYPDGIRTARQFPMWSPCDTNFYVRLALATNNVPICYSQRYHSLTTITAISPNTLIVYANAQGKIGCYGDEPQALTSYVEYGGLTEGPGWDRWTNSAESVRFTGEPSCEVDHSSPTGQYGIVQGTLALGSASQEYKLYEPVYDPDTGEPVLDPLTGEQQTTEVKYQYMLVFTESRYTVTNAQFTASIADTNITYTGETLVPGGFSHECSGLRNEQPVTFQYRVGTNDWASVITSSSSNIWSQIVLFRASAPNHDDAYGTFTITIDPAPLSATISAEDMNYLARPQTPVVTTNVTGLVRGDINPLTCEFRDEIGEWSSEPPQFTNPGKYKLFFRVSAPNHTTFVTNCVFEIPEWDYQVNMDGYYDGCGRSEFEVPIHISDPAWLLNATGESAEHFAINTENQRYINLDRVCDNGLKLWQNYVIDRKELNRKLIAAIRQHGSRVDGNSFVVHFPNVSVLENVGLDVYYRLDRKLRGETEFTAGELSEKYETNIPLGPSDPTGLYVFNIVLAPTNNVATGLAMYEGQAVLASASTVGVIRVSSVLTNIVTAVPWKSLTLDTEEEFDVTAADVVNPNGITEGDRILYFNNASGDFSEWSHTNSMWDAATTVSTRGVTETSADTTRLASSNAFWLVRGEPGAVGATNYVYLVGRYTGEGYEFPLAGGTEASPGCTLVANPTMYDVGLNDLVFVDGVGNAATPHAGDCIVVMDIAGVNNTYYRDTANTTWGREVVTIVKGRPKKSFETNVTIPSGTGFWYYRKAASALKIKFNPADVEP